MKPRNEREREVMRLHRKLPALTRAQVRWIESSVVQNYIYTPGKSCWCTHCGESFTAKIDGDTAVCPHCLRSNAVKKGRHITYSDYAYTQFLSVFHGWQVIRYVLVMWDARKGRKMAIRYLTVMEKWCQPGRPTITLGAPLTVYPWSRMIPYSLWGGPISVKNLGEWYSEWMDVIIYPRMTLLPVYRKIIGDQLDLVHHTAERIIGIYASCPYFERLWKEGRMDDLKECVRHTVSFWKYWPSVKIALRHGFSKDWGTYFDYLRMLSFLRYDMRSPRWVAPADWNATHDLVMARYRNRVDQMARRQHEAAMLRAAIAAEEAARRRGEEAKSYAESFMKRIAKFAGLQIGDDDIVIEPLKTIEQFRDEGAAMHHCVFALGYYKRPDSLILSARMKENGERVETIEVNIKKYCIVQSQGKYNTPTDRHDEIISLVNRAMPRIKALAKPRKAVAASRS